VDDRNEPLQTENVAGEVAAGGCCFGGIPAALKVCADMEPHLDIDASIDLLSGSGRG
jgi:hypothetical protein